jgi:hypothetical protein
MSDSSIEFNRGPVIAGNIGGSGNTGSIRGPVQVNVSVQTDEIAQALDALRAELARLRGALDTTDGPEAQPDDVDTVIDLLPDEPDGGIERAESAWTRLVRRLPTSALDLDSVTKILALLEQVRMLTGATG